MAASFLDKPQSVRAFRRRLLRWYDAHSRDLPWRRDRDPYRVWISEIMLQQTRVAAVLTYYAEFLRRFPNVQALAKARESAVLAAWSGLGYYRRARFLHAAARIITRDLGGKFPRTAAGWLELPGIGRYTSAAIASIAFDDPQAVVDGNVERVLQRLLGDPRLSNRRGWTIAQDLLDPGRPGDFNQAMMELGATVCLPGKPLCRECPVSAYCATRGPSPRTRPEIRRRATFTCTLALRETSVFLVQRPRHASLMPAMWELPQTSSSGGQSSSKNTVITVRHSITSTDYRVRVLRGRKPSQPGRWVCFDDLHRLPLTGLTRKILRHLNTGGIS